jgi:IS30 family transposase
MYKQLNQTQRYALATMKKAGHSHNFIAHCLGIHKSTVSRELRRNSSTKGSYNALNAQLYADDRKREKPHRLFFNSSMKELIIEKLAQEQWSPEQINGWCKATGTPMVSHETI